MYLLVFGLLVYSCTDEGLTKSESFIGYELTSPDGYVLADSPEALKTNMLKSLVQSFGADFDFEIQEIKYIVLDKLTNAEVIYHSNDGFTRNVMFNWIHDQEGELSAADRIRVKANMIPWCDGNCPDNAPQKTCTSYLVVEESSYGCTCGQPVVGGECVMNFGAFSAQGEGVQVQNQDGTTASTTDVITIDKPILRYTCKEDCKVDGFGNKDCTLKYVVNGILTCNCNGQPATECKSPVPVTN